MPCTLLRVLLVGLIFSATPSTAATPGGELYRQREHLEEAFRARCLQIVEGPTTGDRRHEYHRQLEEIRRLPHQNMLFLTGTGFLDGDDGQDELRQVARDHARHLTALAQSALESGQAALAYQLLHEVAYFDATEPHARAILGLRGVGHSGEPIARRGNRRHPRLPWSRRQYWRVRTNHYEILTNQGSEAAAELARRMEDLHTVWRQLFFDYWSSPDHLQAAWRRQARLGTPSGGRHRVVLFASREEYVRHLRPQQPRIGMTLGFYDLGSNTSYFFSGPEASPSTQVHEATHQLFQELQKSPSRLVPDENFWILEGIALYMESLRRKGPCAQVGGIYSERLQYARYRSLQEGFYVPLEQLVILGRDALQEDPRIRRLYSQAAGLTHFLMDGDLARHRSGVIDYVRRVYRGRAGRDALARATGTRLATLDQEYRDFLNVTDRDLQESSLPEDSIRSLCLGRTAVTDQGLAALSPQRTLHWLDLAHTPVSDQGLAFIRGAAGLRQVNLERTAITDRTLALLSQCAQLEELDVSHTAVTDSGIQHIAALPQLRALWLTGTRITDRSVDLLSTLKTLEQLDVSATRVTEQGRQEVQRQLPNVTLQK